MEKRKLNHRVLFLMIIGILLICIGLVYLLYSNFSSSKFGVLDESTLIQIPADQIPEDTLYITEGRRYYQRGTMTLIVPSIDVFTPVGESTLPAGLKEMPGLYEVSQLPGEGNVNVSIAGHRDIHDQVFLAMEQIKDGDYAYLIYDDIIYQYLYKDTQIVTPYAWEVIKPQGFSCLTLTTCDPIGTTIHRMVVRMELQSQTDFADDYPYLPKQNQ